jgi:Mg2+ and Co2+ transporter CorA
MKQDEILQKGGIPSPFVTLRDMYRIIASEWVVVNTCFQRELNTIEWNLENEDPGLERLRGHLNSLYVTQRRVTLYEMFIKEQRDACRQHGRRYWNQSSSRGNLKAMENVASTLETDFAFVSNLVEKNQERVAKNINLLIALISVAESRVGILNGKRIEALTLVAIFFLPFSLVSSVMNINGELGPGQPKQYIFWAVSVLLSFLLVVIYLVYSTSWVLRRAAS